MKEKKRWNIKYQLSKNQKKILKSIYHHNCKKWYFQFRCRVKIRHFIPYYRCRFMVAICHMATKCFHLETNFCLCRHTLMHFFPMIIWQKSHFFRNFLMKFSFSLWSFNENNVSSKILWQNSAPKAESA